MVPCSVLVISEPGAERPRVPFVPLICAEVRTMTKKIEKSFRGTIADACLGDRDSTVRANKIRGSVHFSP